MFKSNTRLAEVNVAKSKSRFVSKDIWINCRDLVAIQGDICSEERAA